MSINIQDPELKNIENKIKNAWFHLLAFYDGICLQIGEVESFLDCSSANDPEINQVCAFAGIFDEQREHVTLPLIYNDREKGHLTMVVKGNAEYGFPQFLNDVPRAADLRRKQSSSLIPEGVIFLTAKEEIWTNSIALEILQHLELDAFKLLTELFGEEDDSFEKMLYNKNVMVMERSLKQYDITGILIPVLADAETAQGLLCILSDSTLIHQKDKELVSKSAMILEIHHRVKNNLQTIASLLRLQMRSVKSRTVENAFMESINRITSIAIIHEELSKAGLNEIDLKETIKSIMEMILENMVVKTKNITGTISGDNVQISTSKASVLALCITEMVQNSVKHAFSYRGKGSIRVAIEEKNGMITIICEDDGVGYNPQKNKSSLGMDIIRMLTEETLKGQFYIEGHTYGTISKIMIPSQNIM
jgi:two-component system, sensor histidine kinase PdtaS